MIQTTNAQHSAPAMIHPAPIPVPMNQTKANESKPIHIRHATANTVSSFDGSNEMLKNH